MNAFTEALISKEENLKYRDKLMLFGQFVGEWDFEWHDKNANGKERIIPGEWIFSFVLEGSAVQDVFICPSRKERFKLKQPDSEYGTTIRFYNPKKDAWDVFYGCTGEATLLEAKPEGDKIVLTCLNTQDHIMKWVFSDIKKDSFHWQHMFSKDNGGTWNINGELFAKRRK
ncbi:hypothetical protein [Clostridium oryzae]|uniref:DUF1579 domain-containing protein n=1 Tax=Clostridium oryzae TaxID=1450648 RepID=A0A1V4I9H2_9CLOT|nr:hypothetical protein [Clostridium oryzae]OPJ56632.1 hypothetical protein CLORY_42350 [Clostridium oryzae]